MENIFDRANEEAEERIDLIRHKLKFIEQKPVVICIESLEPLRIAVDAVPEMVSIAGGAPGPEDESVSWESIRSQNPDIVIVMLRGLSIASAMKHITLLLAQPGFADLKAAKNNRVYIADGDKYFYSKGPAMVDSVEILAEIINPKQFIFGYEGNSWIKFSV